MLQVSGLGDGEVLGVVLDEQLLNLLLALQ